MKRIKVIFAAVLTLCIIAVLCSCGIENNAPYIGENGNWWVGETDLGYSATGPKGDAGEKGDSIKVVDVKKVSSQNNVDTYKITFSDGSSTTYTVTNGNDGNSITVTKTEKISSSNDIDTYKITFSDGKSTTFTVTNGTNGSSVTVLKTEKISSIDGVDTYKINFSDGGSTTYTVTNGRPITVLNTEKISSNGNADTYRITFSDGGNTTYTVINGIDGTSITVSGFEKILSVGNIDTYKISFSDGSSTTYTVTHGIDGNTPYIGENGNWWIDSIDTGILADPHTSGEDATEGLYFEIMSLNGSAGMVVTKYNGTQTDVVIPDYVGLVPVIGIESTAFNSKTSLKSIKLSSNTVYLDDSVFEGCTSLASVDFNGCKIDKIPSNAFKNTEIMQIQIPDTVKELGSYAFANTPLANINYDNVTRFDTYCFDNTLLPYLYLKEDVEFIGTYAVNDTFIYFEAEALPDEWKNNIGSHYITDCHISGDYLYSVNGLGASIHRYLGSESKISIPETISNLPVKEIGYGFNSLTENIIDYYLDTATPDFKNVALLKEVKIPDGVTKIESSFVSCGTMVFIPASVNIISSDIYKSNTNYFVFADSALPTVKQGLIDSGTTLTDINRYTFRYTLSADTNDIYCLEESNMYFFKETIGYSLLAYMGLSELNITIPATVNGAAMHTIRSYSIVENGSNYIENIKLSSGINKIQGNAIYGDFISVFIPESVTIINAYGITNNVDYYFVEVSEKPTEWDTYWNSSASVANVYYSSSQNILVSSNATYLYVKNESSITLVKYLGSSSTIKIPRQIDGYNITNIKEGFFSSSGSKTFYIPKEVKNIEEKAFTNTSYSYFNFYFEVDAIPSDWNSYWYYNSYYATNTNYVRHYFSQIFTY